MKIAQVRVRPLLLRNRVPYHWAQGVRRHGPVLLVEIESDTGLTGIGETVGTIDTEAMASMLRRIGESWKGRDAYDIAALCASTCKGDFVARSANVPRFVNRLLAGLEMALWDLAGKAASLPVHDLLGGSVRADVGYFDFLQGHDDDELARDAARAAAADAAVVYLKIGRGEAHDLRTVAAVREALGDRRLRLDANEAWDVLTAIRMIRKLERYEPECIEQPTPSGSIAALAQVRGSVGVPIAADQCVYTLGDVYEVCRQRAADLIVLGLHETGGIGPLRKAAAVAEAAGIDICLHGIFESGISTCASWQAAVTLPNLDDGNQIMCQLLAEDLVATPSLAPDRGRLALPRAPGLGFALDPASLARADEAWHSAQGQIS